MQIQTDLGHLFNVCQYVWVHVSAVPDFVLHLCLVPSLLAVEILQTSRKHMLCCLTLLTGGVANSVTILDVARALIPVAQFHQVSETYFVISSSKQSRLQHFVAVVPFGPAKQADEDCTVDEHEYSAPFEAALGILGCLLLSKMVQQQPVGTSSVIPAVALV